MIKLHKSFVLKNSKIVNIDELLIPYYNTITVNLCSGVNTICIDTASVLHNAIHKNWIVMVELYINMKYDLSKLNNLGLCPLAYAVFSNNIKISTMLLRANVNPNWRILCDIKNDHITLNKCTKPTRHINIYPVNTSLLCIAISNNQCEMVELLIKYGAIESYNNKLNTEFLVDCIFRSIYNQKTMFDILLKHKLLDIKPSRKTISKLINGIISTNNYKILISFLSLFKLIDTNIFANYNIYYSSISFSDYDMVKLLIRHGLNINNQYLNNKTMLYIGSSYQNLKLISSLIRNGADPTIKNICGKDAYNILSNIYKLSGSDIGKMYSKDILKKKLRCYYYMINYQKHLITTVVTSKLPNISSVDISSIIFGFLTGRKNIM